MFRKALVVVLVRFAAMFVVAASAALCTKGAFAIVFGVIGVVVGVKVLRATLRVNLPRVVSLVAAILSATVMVGVVRLVIENMGRVDSAYLYNFGLAVIGIFSLGVFSVVICQLMVFGVLTPDHSPRTAEAVDDDDWFNPGRIGFKDWL